MCNSSVSEDFVVIRGWNSKYQHSCIAYNSDTGEFTVNNPGFYIVYDHLAFEWKERGTRSNIIKQQIQAKHLEGTVYSKNYTLASDMRAIQKDDPLVGYIPSYNSRVTTVVYLRKGAVLTIEAQPIELLMVSNSYSSFGLFKL